jgi:hypothetical protein
VLFEALDLKSVQKQQQTASCSDSLRTSPQNFAIRSEGLVPNIVKSCCQHISEHGLDVVGIFRIDSSKKRIKEIKELFDSGQQVQLDSSHNPNDVACILKEYLRTLPEPLLTRELYSNFLAATRIKNNEAKLDTLRLLVCLLPVANRDTLQVLLRLLHQVRSHSIGGNKMDSFNLAMVFGPNLLKKHKMSAASNSDFSVDKYNLIDDIDAVISITKYLIEHQDAIFYIDEDTHNELIQTIDSVSQPEDVNSILTRKIAANIGVASLVDSNPKTKDFIDNNNRTSRTKLHKVSHHFVSGSSLLQPISFINSPSHSPESGAKFAAANELYGQPDSRGLLMIPNKSQKKPSKHTSNKSAKVSAKSLSNLHQSQESPLDHRLAYPQQYKCVNSNTMKICSKFYDKNNSNFNVIGEQETLV